MEKYVRAEMEVVEFDVEDIITTSGDVEDIQPQTYRIELPIA